jgi:antidote-toxin recognition MazE-like antitoxin
MQLTQNTSTQKFKVPALVGELSLSIVLPKSFAIDLGIGKGDFVNIYSEDKKIIVEKSR